jgi:hypothetical protein
MITVTLCPRAAVGVDLTDGNSNGIVQRGVSAGFVGFGIGFFTSESGIATWRWATSVSNRVSDKGSQPGLPWRGRRRKPAKPSITSLSLLAMDPDLSRITFTRTRCTWLGGLVPGHLLTGGGR